MEAIRHDNSQKNNLKRKKTNSKTNQKTDEESALSLPKLGPVIAIDGPAGTGKSSATRRLAETLGFVHIDTGALYRAIAFLTLEKKAKWEAAEKSRKSKKKSAEESMLAVAIAREVHLEFRRVVGKNPANRIFANSRDLTDFIRTPEVTMAASRISAIPDIRLALLSLQRRLGCVGRSILEGRDIGTVIFPDADIKFFLYASIDERAKRRLIELEASGADAPSFEEVKKQIIERDQGDTSRKVAPLKKAEDALEVDTSTLSLDEVVKTMEMTVRKRLSLK